MILHGYGCSWTEGVGSDYEHEESLVDRDDKRLFRNNHSWVKKLSERLNINHVNHGISGNANNKIFNTVVEDIQTGRIKSDDMVAIMWSSSLRDYVPFLPKGEWVSWSVKHLMESPERFINSYRSNNEKYNSFLIDYKDFFIGELFNQNYYNIVNQNYIIFIQKLFEFYNIKYVMCDGIEPMLIDLNRKDDVRGLVNKKNYWGFDKHSFREYLIETNMIDVWEYQDENFKSRATQHPNKKGYEMIADELFKFIIDNKLS